MLYGKALCSGLALIMSQHWVCQTLQVHVIRVGIEPFLPTGSNSPFVVVVCAMELGAPGLGAVDVEGK